MARSGITRRRAAAGLALAPMLAGAVRAAQPADPDVSRSASPERFPEAERAILAGRAPIAHGVTLEIPTLSENGNSVDVGVRVASPWTREDHVRAIHILSEQNPFPRVATFHLSFRAGRADVAARVRLATTQKLVVLAETTAGAVHRAEQEVIVILGACVDGG